MKILVVDDDRFNLRVARDIITANVDHAGVLICDKPETVMELLATENIGVVLLDIVMPGLNGIDLLRQIRRREEYRDIQILMFTGLADQDSLRECFEAGANDFIAKPINPTVLVARTRAAIKVRRYILQLKETLQRIDEQYTDLQDMTRKLQETQFSLFQTEKLASLGQIAAGVAHEINNPLGFVSSNLEILERYLGKVRESLNVYQNLGRQLADPRVPRAVLAGMQQKIAEQQEQNKLGLILDDLEPLIGETREGVDRVAKIVQSLRNFARDGKEDEFARHDLNQIVEEALLIMQNEIKYIAHVHRKLGENLEIECDRVKIGQVLVNILSNAVQAIKNQRRDTLGNITVETGLDGDNIICRIVDDGTGIREEHKSRIFDPFFTTKPVGEGTGLGLSIAYGLVKKHGGDLWMDSEWGRGTLFTIRLPRSGATA